MGANSLCRRLLPILLILLAGSIVYANTFRVPFILDDQATIIRDTFVHDLDNFRPDAIDSKLEHPRWFSYLTFALNYHFGGLDVTGYHAVNLCIHLLAALLVYALLRLTFRTPYFQVEVRGPRSKVQGPDPHFSLLTPQCFIPLFAALLFVVHPVHTQAVTYVVQRMTSQAAMFYLLSVVLYVQARLRLESRVQSPEPKVPSHNFRESKDLGPGTRDLGLRRLVPILLLAGSVVSAVLAMKTKEIAFTLPFAAVLFEFCFFRGAWKRRRLCLLPLLVTIPIVPMSVLATGQSTGKSTGDLLGDMSQQTLVHGKLSQLDYLFTQFRVIVTYLRLLVLPVNQNLDYDYPVYTTFFTPQVFLSFLLLAATFALAMYLFWHTRHASFHAPLLHPSSGDGCVAPTQTSMRSFDPTVRLVAFGIFWFFITLAVESSLISIADVIVEHRLYLPSVGAAAAFASAFFLAARRFPPPVGSKLLVLVAALLVLVLGFATFQRNHVWGDAIRLWQDVVAKSPEKVRPYNNLGVALTNAGRLPEAIEVFSRAIKMDPSHPHAYNNLGRAFILTDRSEDALPLLRMAIRLDLDYDDAYINLAAALNQTRRFRETIALMEPNLGLLGERVEAHYHLGVAYVFLGKREAARRKLAIVSRADADLAADLIRLLGRDAHQAD